MYVSVTLCYALRSVVDHEKYGTYDQHSLIFACWLRDSLLARKLSPGRPAALTGSVRSGYEQVVMWNLEYLAQ
jgi:hypothetical protein